MPVESMDVDQPSGLNKKEKDAPDFTKEIEEKIPHCIQLSKQSGKFNEAIEILLALEKRTRQAGDEPATSRVLVAIVQICFDNKEYSALKTNLMLLSKRRAQIKTSVQKMVAQCVNFAKTTKDKDLQKSLIDTLREVTLGKIHVELERAELTKLLAQIYENEGKITEAAKVLQEVQVETFGSMERVPKAEYILEQMRLCFDAKDFVRGVILSRKISEKSFAKPEFEQVKIKFYQQIIRYYLHEENYLQVAKSYFSLFETPTIQKDQDQWKSCLEHMVAFTVLSPTSVEQNTFQHHLFSLKKLGELPSYKLLLKMFMNVKLISWAEMKKEYENVLGKLEVFTVEGGKKLKGKDDGDETWEVLRKRVTDHNIRVIEAYYSNITMKRFSELLALSVDEAEISLSDLVTSKTIYARIDRPNGIITFMKSSKTTEQLDEWGNDIEKLLGKLERVSHLINREVMVHNQKNKKK